MTSTTSSDKITECEFTKQAWPLLQFLLVFLFQLKYFFLVTIVIICGQLWHCYIYFVIFIIQLFVYIISYRSKVSKSKWIIIIIVLQYTEGTVNNQYTLYVKVSMVTKSEFSQCKFMYVYRVSALNVALFLIDQETIHANKHKKLLITYSPISV